MQLKEFFDYKNQLMEDLLANETVVRLLDENISVNNAGSLAYSNIFPCEYIPETGQEGKTFICFDVDIRRAVNKTYLLSTLYVWVFTHRSRLRLPDGGGLRTDKLCSEICRTINGSRKYGLGELALHYVKRFAPTADYKGKVMAFYAKDFNRLYEPNKYAPSNRRTS